MLARLRESRGSVRSGTMEIHYINKCHSSYAKDSVQASATSGVGCRIRLKFLHTECQQCTNNVQTMYKSKSAVGSDV